MGMGSNIQVIYLRLKSVGEIQLDFDLNLLNKKWVWCSWAGFPVTHGS